VPALEQAHGVAIELVDNDRAEDWNNAYSLWCARDLFDRGFLLSNGDTLHPVSVEQALLADDRPGIVLAVDDVKVLADEEMKVRFSGTGALQQITKLMDPVDAHGEYIGVARIGADAADSLASALEATWSRDPNLYYEDGFQQMVDRGEVITSAAIGDIEWIEVDTLADLERAREIACRC
jgi:choline kinase